jgi:hypothetical protein
MMIKNDYSEDQGELNMEFLNRNQLVNERREFNR